MKNSHLFARPTWHLTTFMILFFMFSPVENAMLSPRLGFLQRKVSTMGKNVPYENHYKTCVYKQTLDHFNYLPESYATFKQKYIVNSRYWGGQNENAPIFVFLGDENPLGDIYHHVGVMSENAQQFKALLVYIEHRYYAESIPFKSRKEAFSNASTLGYLSSAQAIADYADILIHIKKEFRAHNSPVIAIGGSYGGMLAAWFRLKYPHVVLGALASSAPILYFDDITPNNGYYVVATRDFQEESQSCYETIKKSWSEIDRVTSLPGGLAYLSQLLNTCSPHKVKDVPKLKDFFENVYSSAAQYHSNVVTLLCYGIDGEPKGSDILSRISAGLADVMYPRCLDLSINYAKSEAYQGWNWQQCTEMVMPLGRGNETMYFPLPFNLTKFIQKCKKSYEVEPRQHWVTTYYGGHDMKMVFQRFGSNIVFSNGLKDPFSSAGVLKNLSDTLVAITTKKGTHCMDLLPTSPDDPKWLVKQRREEVKVIRGWLEKYYDDLK